MDDAPVVDITSVIAVESLFRPGVRDPWGAELAGHLADLLIYSNSARHFLPYATSADPHEVPDLLRQLAEPEQTLFQPIPYKADELREVNPDILTEAFVSFSGWAARNRSRLKHWADLQFQDWVRNGHFARVRPRFVFNVQALARNSAVEITARNADLSTEQVLHAFDVALRYPLYGELAGANALYLAHPVRSTQQLPQVQRKEGPLPPVPISLRRVVTALAPKLSQTEYVTLIHEGRRLVRDLALVGAKPGSVEPAVGRELAMKLRLPPRLKHVSRPLAWSSAGVMLLALEPQLTVPATLVSAVLTVTAAYWKGGLPRGAASLEWLAWAYEWDLEIPEMPH